MARTAKKLIKQSMLDAEIIGAGETPTADEIEDCFDCLNDMITLWTADGKGAFVYATASVAMVNGKAIYTVGPGGDIDTVRPESIVKVFIRNGSGNDTELDPITFGQFQEKPSKDFQGTPSEYALLPTVPATSLHLYPVPNITDTLHVTVYGGVEVIPSLTTDLEQLFPLAYIVALRSVLAVEIAPLFGTPINPVTAGKAATAKKTISNLNFLNRVEPVHINDSLPTKNNSFNIYTS